MTGPRIVVAMNSGSSSLKFGLYEIGDPPVRRVRGQVVSSSDSGTTLTTQTSDGRQQIRTATEGTESARAADMMLDWLAARGDLRSIAGIGHRVVVGTRHDRPRLITQTLLDELRRLSVQAPEHLPAQIDLITTWQKRMPRTPQVACFDSMFHRTMPRVATILPLPRRFERLGVERYGFHGLSCAFLIEELERLAGAGAARGRVILAHLGHGASLTATRGGTSVDTTMSLTPASGVPMSTRTGDLDPVTYGYLTKIESMTADDFDRLVNHESGLLGVSETSGDVRDLLERESHDIRAAEALELFCYRVRKEIGALAAALGGLDTLVFSGGIGEHSPALRARVSTELAFLGVALDDERNARNEGVISLLSSRVTVRIIPTDEELMIAKGTCGVLQGAAEEGVST